MVLEFALQAHGVNLEENGHFEGGSPDDDFELTEADRKALALAELSDEEIRALRTTGEL